MGSAYARHNQHPLFGSGCIFSIRRDLISFICAGPHYSDVVVQVVALVFCSIQMSPGTDWTVQVPVSPVWRSHLRAPTAVTTKVIVVAATEYESRWPVAVVENTIFTGLTAIPLKNSVVM